MEVLLWGVRGSIPNPERTNMFYGANTTCLELRLDGGGLLVFDAGTGIRALGKTLPDEGVCHIFISHGHSDHTLGLRFFQPVYKPGWTIHLYLPEWLGSLPGRLFDAESFPVALADLQADIIHHVVRPGQSLLIDDDGKPARVECLPGDHPGGSLAYKVYADETVFLFSGDHVIRPGGDAAATRAMLRDVTFAVVDAAFSRADFQENWGHAAWEDWRDLAAESKVRTLVLSHHAPDRTDAELDILQARNGQHGDMDVVVARERTRFFLSGKSAPAYPSTWLQTFIESLSRYKEESVLLDRILFKAREITRADAGTVFLADGDELVFAYAHNDTLFSESSSRKSIYVTMRLPINTTSIAGYAAVTGESLNLPDVYDLPENTPYHFNNSLDKKSGYRTHSMFTVPMLSHSGKLLGVLQLLNSMDEGGRPRAFPHEMEESVRILAREASVFLEISAQVRSGIGQLLRAAMLHDPMETGPHAERVGAIAAELYRHWAKTRGEDPETTRYVQSQLRLAAMLHDIGKVGVSDLVLKKNGPLTDEEYAVMKGHATLGATLFPTGEKDLVELAHEISLHHHQKWNGQGYPPVKDGAPLGGETIPLAARITAIADVFDALVSPRCYKTPWSFEKAEEILHKDAGSHFDPELVTCFSEIMDTVKLIYQRFPDETAGRKE